MPYTGTGIFVRVYQWVQDAANGIFVDATRTDTDSNDIAAGLTNCVTRDGQSPWLANLPAGGFKITGLANGTNATDSVNYGQVFTNPTFSGLTATGVVNFAGATSVSVPTVTIGDNSTNAASTAFVQATAFSAALPAQAGNAGKFVTTNGTTASWTDTFTIPITFNSSSVVTFGTRVNEAKGADIASAATIDLSTSTGNLVHITGTTTITAITIPSGAERTLVFDGALTLTHNATTLILPGGVSITTATGDTCIVRGDGSGNARVINYSRATGFPVTTPPGIRLLATLTPTASANVDALTAFSSTYDNYLIIGDGITVGTSDSLNVRFAVAGVVDTGSNYVAGVNESGAVSATSTSVTLNVGGPTVFGGGRGVNFVINLLNVNDASRLKSFHSEATLQSATTPAFFRSVTGGVYLPSSVISGIRFFWNGGNNFSATGSIRIYGYNNS